MGSSKLKEIITCRVCLETFDEVSKYPRMLYCGHSFCHACIGWLMVKRPSCPTCKTRIGFTSMDSVPINYSLLSLVNAGVQTSNPTNNGNLVEIDLETDNPIASGSQKRKYKSEGHCHEHDNRKELRCMDCNMWICAMCGMLLHKHCRTLLVADAYKELKKHVSKKVKRELGERKTKAETFTESLRLLDEERKSFIEEIQAKELEIKAKELELKDRERRIEELELLRSEEERFCDTLNQLQVTVEGSNDDEFSEALSELEKFLDLGNPPIPIDVSLQVDLPQTKEALGTLCQDVPVYVVEERFEGPRYGKVTEKDGRIWVHSFQLRKPDAALFNFQELLNQLNGSDELPKTGFLQLTHDVYDSDVVEEDGAEGVPLEVIIETDGVSDRAKNFILLCSALRGPSYKGQPIRGDPSDSYRICDGPPAVEGVIRKEDTRTPRKEADVYGMRDDNSWLGIQLKDETSRSSHKVGVVIAGLQTLKELHGGTYSVSGCGLVL